MNLNQKVYEEDQAKEFHKLSKLTDEFLDYIKKDEQISESEQEDEMEDIMSVLTMNRKIRENTFSQNLLPGVQKDNPDLQKLWGLLPFSKKPKFPEPTNFDDEGEGSDDSSNSIVDYFAGVKNDKKPFVKKQPPQNSIKPKTWNILKKKYSKTPFRKKPKKRKPSYSGIKFFEIV